MTPVTSKISADSKEWIIQRCINAFKNQYQDWPGYCERLLNREEMLVALKECDQLWPDYEFRGHKVIDAHRPDMESRPPTADEIAGMEWWNSKTEVERGRRVGALQENVTLAATAIVTYWTWRGAENEGTGHARVDRYRTRYAGGILR